MPNVIPRSILLREVFSFFSELFFVHLTSKRGNMSNNFLYNQCGEVESVEKEVAKNTRIKKFK